jgi:K+-transporting ATPase A subunit
MRRLRLALIPYALLLVLVLAPVAHAADNDGRGFYGATDDKAITNIMFGVIVFFPLFVFLMSMLQRSLENRKERRKAAEKNIASWHGGW